MKWIEASLLLVITMTNLSCGGASTGSAIEEGTPNEVVARPESPPEPIRLEAVEAMLADEGYQGSFVLRRDAAEGHEMAIAGRELAQTPHSPCSTFKIPNSLIGLETGVVSDGSFFLPWDGEERSITSWNRDHDLESALANSVVWYYQEIARRIGIEQMNQWVTSFDYGNAEIGAEVDTFWLSGPLQITPVQQVEFLARLTSGELPVSDRSLNILREIMPRRTEGDAVIAAKTGTCLDETRSHGWLVGWVEEPTESGEQPNITAQFALLLTIEGTDVEELQSSRWELAARALGLADAL